MLGVPKNGVILQPHDRRWIEEYNAVKRVFIETFSDNIIFIEHVGSTSIDGIQAKPMLDIAVVFKDISESVFKQMKDIGYIFYGEVAIGKFLFVQRGKDDRSFQHIHCYKENNLTLYYEQIQLRDFLRNHPEYAKEYESLKQRLAQTYPDNRKEYTAGKQFFFDKIKALIRQEEFSSPNEQNTNLIFPK